MPPKAKAPEGPSKKTVQKKKQQLVEDKTFGLKNKNKSKKVQQQIKSIEKNVMNSGDPKMRKLEEQRKKAKAEAKARKQAMEEEQNALFGEALLAVTKKSTINQKFGKVEAKGRDANDEETKKSTSRAMKMMYQMDAQEVSEKLREDPSYVPTIEDEIEEKRQKMIEGLQGKGTPVTPETFAAWQERKRKERLNDAKRKVEAELRKKKGGKGLSVLSGRALYEYKKDLFDKVDDDDGIAEDGPEMDATERLGNGSATQQLPASSSLITDKLAENVQSDLFLQGEDDDLDDMDDDV